MTTIVECTDGKSSTVAATPRSRLKSGSRAARTDGPRCPQGRPPAHEKLSSCGTATKNRYGGKGVLNAVGP